MKNLKLLSMISLILSIVACISDDDQDYIKGPLTDTSATIICLPPELTIINSSEYIVKRIYVHDTANYMDTEEEPDSELSTNEEIDIPVSDGDLEYFTFIRNITSTSSMEIAVTTSSPIYFRECYKYRLHIFEEDFMLKKEDNYTTVDTNNEE